MRLKEGQRALQGKRKDRDEWTQMEKYWFHMMERETASHERAEEEQIREKNGTTHKKKPTAR